MSSSAGTGHHHVYATRCQLDTITAVLPVDRDRLTEYLAGFPGVELASDASEQTVWFELAHVHGGQPDLEVARRVGDAWASNPFGWWWQASVRPWFDAATVALTKTVGTYHEAMFGIPDVHVGKRRDGPFVLVLGMYTDSRVAEWGDRVLRCGYRKRLARISREGFESFSVFDDSGRSVLSALADGSPGPAVTRSGPPQPDAEPPHCWEQPLLGYLGDGEYAISHLTRSPSARTMARAAPATFRIEVRAPIGVPLGRYSLSDCSSGGCRVHQIERLDARLSYPRHFKL